MDWEDLLNSLRELLAERGSAELEKRVRDLLKERASDDWLSSCGQVLSDGQLDQAKSVVSDFLRDHPDLSGIRKRLELILLLERRKAARPPTSKVRIREQLLQSVNALVSSGKLVAVEEMLEEALAEDEDPELLDLLGRVYMLQRRPQQAAAVMQRALLARRQKIAFIEQPQAVVHALEMDDEAVTAADLEYITSDASVFAGLDASSIWQDEVAEPVKSQPEESYLAGLAHGLGASDGNETVISPVFVPVVAEDTCATSTEQCKTLSLSRARKSVDVASTPQGTKILVRHAPHSKVEQSHSTRVPVTAVDDLCDAAFGQPLTPEKAPLDKPRPAGSESYYSDSDIQELVGGIALGARNESEPLFGGAQVHQQDSYEPESDFFDNDEILVEQDELNFDVIDEFVIDDRDIDDEYAAYAFDPDDIYDSLESSCSDAELADGRVSREDRALQKAIELISRAGWSSAMLPLVQQIFVMSGWGATRLALEREIDKGMAPEELILAAHVKVLWTENDYYWIAYDRSGSSNLSQYVMSWPTALLLVRSFESLPQIEELEQFIESLFEDWYGRPSLRRAFRSFNRFLWFRVSNLQGCLPANQPFNFCSPHELPVEEYSDLGMGDPLGIERTAKLRAFGVFQTKHPQEPGSYLSDKPLPVEAYSMASQTNKEILNDA